MLFEEFIGVNPESVDVLAARHTVKGISIHDNKILLLESNRGDYTFPGGGIERDESHHDALAREIIEETGYTCERISTNIGQIILRRKDIFDNSKMYELISHYYLFKTSISQTNLQLGSRERYLGLKPVWIDIDEAIQKNKEYLDNKSTIKFWINQELFVLEFISNNRADMKW